ncbi:VOC family protein [Polaromonas aquatica]|uniref:VOC family protein n=1 Tax=Polaromonas aquatica TaxID=332657 RepID=UPI003D64AE19
MFSHITVGCSDLDISSRFYDAILLPLGLVRRLVPPRPGRLWSCWIMPGAELPRFYIYLPYDGRPCTSGNGSMVAFVAPNPESVDAAYENGIKEGGTDDGKPGPRDRYGAGYYGAYIRDPDGNKIHLVYRGDLLPRAPDAVAIK